VFFVDAKDGSTFSGIYMYTHWSGTVLWKQVREALARGRDRWGDSQYLGRILFCELVRESVLDTTGYGLSTRLWDNEHAIIRVDDLDSRVSFHRSGKERSPNDKGVASWSYEEYVAVPEAELERAYFGNNGEGESEDAEADQPTPKPAKKAAAKKKAPAKKPAAKKPAKPKSKKKK